MGELNQSLDISDTQKVSNIETNENPELKQKLDTIKNSPLKELFGFDKFLNYLSNQKDSTKLDNVIVLLESSKGREQVIEYFDVDNEDEGKGFFTDETYNQFEIFFKDIIKKIKVDKITTKVDKITTKVDKITTKVDKITTKVGETTNEVKEKEKEKEKKYDETIILLNNHAEKHPKLKKLLADIDNPEKNTDDKIDFLGKNEKEIFNILFEDAKQTGNYKDVKIVADNFLSLNIISQDRHDEIYDKIIKSTEQESNSKSFEYTDEDKLLPSYDKRGDTLVKTTPESKITIKDGKMTCKSNESGLKLVDYNSLDEEGKAFAEKTKFQTEEKELNGELGDNEIKRKFLDQILGIIGNRDPNSISSSEINFLTSEISDKFPLLKDTITSINQSNESSSKKIEYLIKMLYANITGTTNITELEGKDLNYIISNCKKKLEDNDNEINKKLEQAKKTNKELQQKYPNLDEKTIQDKIKSQETRMQDTVKFCDKFGLSSLGHISFIKKFTREINKQEVINPIPDDLGTGLEFEKGQKKYCKYLAILCGKKEIDLFKPDISKDGAGLKYGITKDYIENLLKSRQVLSFNGELKTLKMQELIEEGEKVDGMDYI
ncbi:MAG: hypothetical protein WC850_05640 [Candidatus Gracilibacteria bacterium]